MRVINAAMAGPSTASADAAAVVVEAVAEVVTEVATFGSGGSPDSWRQARA